MNYFDIDQFRADWIDLHTFTDDGTLATGRWQVRKKWIGWTVIDPEGRIHLATGTSRSEWRTATEYAHHAAEVHA